MRAGNRHGKQPVLQVKLLDEVPLGIPLSRRHIQECAVRRAYEACRRLCATASASVETHPLERLSRRGFAVWHNRVRVDAK